MKAVDFSFPHSGAVYGEEMAATGVRAEPRGGAAPRADVHHSLRHRGQVHGDGGGEEQEARQETGGQQDDPEAPGPAHGERRRLPEY